MSLWWGEHTDEKEDVSVDGYSGMSAAGQDRRNDGCHQGTEVEKIVTTFKWFLPLSIWNIAPYYHQDLQLSDFRW